jgi:hypothetical protein
MITSGFGVVHSSNFDITVQYSHFRFRIAHIEADIKIISDAHQQASTNLGTDGIIFILHG